MKKTTIIMIATSVVFLLVVIGNVVYHASLGTDYNHSPIEIENNASCISRNVDSFSAIDIMRYGKRRNQDIYLQELASVNVEQSDTASTPMIIMPEELKKYLVSENDNDTLKIYFRVPAEDTIKGSPNYRPWPNLICKTPITILTPNKVNRIRMRLNATVNLNGFSSDSIRVLGSDNSFRFNNSRFAEVICGNSSYLILNQSTIDRVKVPETAKSLTMAGDSLSLVGNILWNSSSKNKPELTLKHVAVKDIRYSGPAFSFDCDSATVSNITVK